MIPVAHGLTIPIGGVTLLDYQVIYPISTIPLTFQALDEFYQAIFQFIPYDQLRISTIAVLSHFHTSHFTRQSVNPLLQYSIGYFMTSNTPMCSIIGSFYGPGLYA